MLRPKFAKDEIEPGVPAEIELDDRLYYFSRTISTLMVAGYVPDWDTAKCVKESVQNQLDEALGSDTRPYYGVLGPDEIWLRDAGRGVPFDFILLIGKSGKRDDDRMVGKHGEGEVVSTMVAARQGLVKVMASQQWLVRGRLAPYEATGDDILVLDLYETPMAPREGTFWYYQGPGVAEGLAEALEAFKRHQGALHTGALGYNEARRALAKADIDLPEMGKAALVHISHDEYGRLYSRGQLVNERVDRLVLSYNLADTPGRDRGGFVWEQAAAEVEAIWSRYASADDIDTVLHYVGGMAYYYAEPNFQAGPPAAALRKGLKQFEARTRLRVCWAVNGTDDALITDARDRGGFQVLRYSAEPPTWVRDAVPHITKYVQPASGKRIVKRPPKGLAEAVQSLVKLLGVEGIEVVYLKDLAVDGSSVKGTSTLKLDPGRCKTWDFGRLLDTVVHEIAHVVSGADDCTRRHAQAISDIHTALTLRLLADPAAYRALGQAQQIFTAWAQAPAADKEA